MQSDKLAMHWVDRGSEPPQLPGIRAVRTPAWVQFYAHGAGARPTDHDWRLFHNNLKTIFHGLCAYCELPDPGEVDHFQPKSKFPQLVYRWDNWLFSCHPCNQAKREKWPNGGYVNPCSSMAFERPERYFDFSTRTKRIKPKEGLS